MKLFLCLMMMMMSSTWSFAVQTVAPFARTGLIISGGGVAHLGSGKILVLSQKGAGKILNTNGETIREFDLNVHFNRPPMAFPGGGAMAVSIAPTLVGRTDLFFFNQNGELFKTLSYQGIAPSILKLEADGTVQFNPMGRSLYFNARGDVVREITFNPNLIFFTPIYNFKNGYFSATGIREGYRVYQSDSFLSRNMQVIQEMERGVPSYPPAILDGDIAVVPRWDGEIYAATSNGERLDVTMADEFIIEPAITLDGTHAWVATTTMTGILKIENGAFVVPRVLPYGIGGMRRLGPTRLIAHNWDNIVVLDQKRALGNQNEVVERFPVKLSGNDFLTGTIIHLREQMYLTYSRNGDLFIIHLKSL